MTKIIDLFGQPLGADTVIGVRVKLTVVDPMGVLKIITVLVNAGGETDSMDVVDAAIKFTNAGGFQHNGVQGYNYTVQAAGIAALFVGGYDGAVITMASPI